MWLTSSVRCSHAVQALNDKKRLASSYSNFERRCVAAAAQPFCRQRRLHGHAAYALL